MSDRITPCDCILPLLIPCESHHRGDELPRGREWLICVICGHWHQETDRAKVELVHEAQKRWEADQDAEDKRVAQLPLCARYKRTHRYITLRGGSEACRDCGKSRRELEAQ